MTRVLQTETKAAPAQTLMPPGRFALQRKCACEDSDSLKEGCDACSTRGLSLQRSTGGSKAGSRRSADVPPIVNDVLRSAGTPLDTATRAFMEPRFGHDFSRVRVHTDAAAAESARSVNALAYTVGRDVVFGEGRYQPSTGAGAGLLAHELTHVIQQGNTDSNLSKLSVEPEDNHFEREADQVAAQITQSHSVPALMSHSGFAVQRQIGVGSDLTATRFSGNLILEEVLDNNQVLEKNVSSGTAVRLIQESLLAQGYTLPVFGADGDFGDETETAVRQFQIDTGATMLDGKVGPETMRLLDMHDPGGTAPTGPRATPAPAIGPAPPPATGVVFSEEATEQFAGYDNSVAPNWLVLPVNGRRRAAAAIAPAAARPTITSLAPAVATVDPTSDGISVTGVAHGTTTIQATEGGVVLDTLQISVKDQVSKSAAFHYVCDSAVPPHCSNGAPAADEMRSLLNRVWERQANVRFTNGGQANVVAPGDLGPDVDWTSPGGGEWNTVTALGLGADYNVFRVLHYLQDGAETNNAADSGANTLIGDAPCADGFGLPHECGHSLGLDHPDGFIMTPCGGGRVNGRVSKAMADKVNP